MNIFITGIAGFVGKNLAKILIKEGHKLYGIDNFYNSTLVDVPDDVEFLKCDIVDKQWSDWLKDKKIDKIIHLAAQSSGEISFVEPLYDVNTNVIGTINVCMFAKENGVSQIIFASSMSVYGENQGQVNELTPAVPLSLYAVGKKASEDYLRIFSHQYSIDVKCLRLFNIYGNGQNLANLSQGMVSIFLAQLLSKEKHILVKGGLERYRDFIHVFDVVELLSLLINPVVMTSQFETFNVGTGIKTTVGEVILYLKSEFQIDKNVVVTTSTVGDQTGIIADNGYMKSKYKNEFISFTDGLKLWKCDHE
jgi:UDP-glucose 4-epimerase